MSKVRAWIRQQVSEVVSDDEKRFRLQMVWVFRIVSIIVLVMTAVNVLTRHYESIGMTLSFGVLCLLSTVILDKRPAYERWVILVLLLAVTGIFGYYIISGEPEGFSPIWMCLVPPVALLLLGRWRGGSISIGLLMMMIALMWTPWGQSLLQYDYPEIFLMRLPLVYAAAFGVSWFLEYVREVTQKKLLETQRSLEHLYRHDALTGALNRYGFNEHILQAAQACHPNGLALIIIDIDDFKKVNDRYGHPAGDAALCGIAKTVGGMLGDSGEFSRWGGEEFAVLLDQQEDAQEIAESIRLAVQNMRVIFGKRRVPVTVSLGLTVCPPDVPLDVERLVTLTDQQLYRAKMSGKNQVACCTYTEAEE